MPRDLTDEMLAATLAATVRPAFFFHFALDSGDLRLWTGPGPIDWNGATWTGAGTLAKIGTIRETTDVAAPSVDYQLSGISSDVIAIALAEHYQGRVERLYFGLFDADGEMIPDPMQLRVGHADTMTIEDQGETASLTMTSQNGLSDMDTPKVRRYTDQDQQSLFPGDKFMEFQPAIQNVPITWGAKGTGTA